MGMAGYYSRTALIPQLIVILSFLRDSNHNVSKKLFIRSLWALDDLQLANDWIAIFNNE